MTPPLLGRAQPNVDLVKVTHLEASDNLGLLRKAEDARLGLKDCLKEEDPGLRNRPVTSDPRTDREGRAEDPETYPQLLDLYLSPRLIRKRYKYASITQAVKKLPNLITTKHSMYERTLTSIKGAPHLIYKDRIFSLNRD